MPDVSAINRYLQAKLQCENLGEVTAVEAAKWLDQQGLLTDSRIRPGKPLRNLLRKGLIIGQLQEANRGWYIRPCRLTA